MTPIYEDFKKYVIPSQLVMSILISILMICVASIVGSAICLMNYNSMCIAVYLVGVLGIGIIIGVSVMYIRYICCDVSHHIEPTDPPSPKHKKSKKSKTPKDETIIVIDNPMV